MKNSKEMIKEVEKVENNPVIRVYENDETLPNSSDHWYGKVYQQDNKGKSFEFNISNHTDPDTKYNWRAVSKCRAGWLTIFDRENLTPKEMVYYFSKDTKNVQVWKEFENGKGLWVDVITFKGGRFNNVDKAILENLTISNMHSDFPKMVDYNLWERVGAKNHSHFAYKPNK